MDLSLSRHDEHVPQLDHEGYSPLHRWQAVFGSDRRMPPQVTGAGERVCTVQYAPQRNDMGDMAQCFWTLLTPDR